MKHKMLLIILLILLIVLIIIVIVLIRLWNKIPQILVQQTKQTPQLYITKLELT